MLKSLLNKNPNEFQLETDDGLVPVKVRKNAQARRMVLRVDSSTGAVRITVPKYTSMRAAKAFAQDHQSWIEEERAKAQTGPAIEHGEQIMLRGCMLNIVFTDAPPRKVVVTDSDISVGGPADNATGRLVRFLKAEARKDLEVRSKIHAETLDVQFKRISIGDMRSRWGSCSSKGTLRFNWRLVMAPTEVLDYVAAHEVAHLVEMNHSPQFWAEVEKCVPDYTRHRAWLKADGQNLMRLNVD